MQNKRLTAADAVLTSRPFWWVITALPFIAGYFSQEVTFSATAVIGTIYFSFPYNLYMYGINDIYDYESDVRNPRKNSLEGALLDQSKQRQLLRLIVILNLPFLIYLSVVGSVQSRLWLAAIVFAAAAYSARPLRLKEAPFLDSLGSAFRYTAPFIFGIVLAGGTSIPWPIFGAFFLWAMSNHAFSAIQDIKPDREAGTKSIATYLGATNTVLFCFLGYMLAASIPALVYRKEGIIPTVLLMPYVGLVARTLMVRDKETSPVFHRTWLLFTYLNYPLTALLAMYLLSLQVSNL